MRITTGAPLPQGADAVVQVEDTKLIESQDEVKKGKPREYLSKATLLRFIWSVNLELCYF